jgi:nucleotide-binding universal stress UspA family protein
MPIIGSQIALNLDTILFATDFSSGAENAALYVKALADRYQSQVRLMHVLNAGFALQGADAGLNIDTIRRNGKEGLARVANELALHNIRVDTVLAEGMDPAAEILQAAEDRSIDLLVIGTRGRTGLARLVLGSTAEHVIHAARCPVLAIGPAVAPPKLALNVQRIVYATDFSPEAAKACVFASSFAQDFGAHLYLCHVLPKHPHALNEEKLNQQYIGELKNLLPDVAREWCEPECVLEHGVAADGILLLAHRVQADLIVLGTRRASHWYDHFKTGVAFQVIGNSHCPVLTIRE